MATVRCKFRPSTVEGELGCIFYQVIHERIARQLKTAYRIYTNEWDPASLDIVLSVADEERAFYLSAIRDKIKCELNRIERIITKFDHLGRSYRSDDVLVEFLSIAEKYTIFEFMEEVIANLNKMGKLRTAEAYTTTLNSFRRFRENRDVMLERMDSEMMQIYEAYLKEHEITPNTSSFYMRNLRATYNRAVEKGIVSQRYPFKHVYTGVDKTIKRAIPLRIVKQIKEMDLSDNPQLDYARDLFMFSFYTRGMSFIDMAYLRKKDLANGILTYRRCKTGQQLLIKWEKCMQEIVDKYNTGDSIRLLPILHTSMGEDRKQYIYARHNVNRYLKTIGERLKQPIPLTMYVARHTWASIAKSKNIPLSVISEGMGHDSEATTRIYLASLDTFAVDRANRLILNLL